MKFRPFYIFLFVFSFSFLASKIEARIDNTVLENNRKLDSKSSDKDSIYLNQKLFVLGKFDYKNHDKFTEVKPIHSSKEIYLDKTVYSAFISMHEAAKMVNVDLKIISGTRNFNEQKRIWERKWTTYKSLKSKNRALKILEYSSMPSTSRHHWGTDLDLNSLNNSYFNSGKGKQEYDWLSKHANDYGFYQVYTLKTTDRTGYNLENWHWSYLPLACEYLNFYNKHITYKDIKGFKGDTLAKELQMINTYVNGLSIKAKAYN